MTKIFAALDTTDYSNAYDLAQDMSDVGCGIKLGMEFFYSNGPQGVEGLRNAFPELPIFLDLKSHDIPTTVMKSYKALLPLQVDYINLHALGGGEMMRDAVNGLREEADKQNVKAPKVLGVTILTSHKPEDLCTIGLCDDYSLEDHVKNLALLTQKSGLDGVVCSGKEIVTLRQNCGSEFILMVPGIRPAGSNTNDQQRVMTPLEAMQAGATHLVIGRPITEAQEPKKAAFDILQSLKSPV